MSEYPTAVFVPETDEQFKLAIDQCLEQINRLRQEMEKDQKEIDRLKAETRVILAQLKAA
ncbi:MAG TPA: hypothetical protein VKU00_27940 [Chthonomonadaceae bacterium]|nr:hypothetical protein [Chthonomonadaceae bacterium]